MRRTKATQIYRKTGNLRAEQLLLGHTKLESTVRYLGIEVDDALNRRADRALIVDHRHHPGGPLRAKGSVWRGFALTPRKARPITPDPKIRSLGPLKSLKSPTEKMALTQGPAPKFTP
jgi:hypothetical protein